MLKGVKGNKITIECNNCKTEFEKNLTGVISNRLEEFNQYENLQAHCDNCKTFEIFNLNIPVDATDEPFLTGDLPVEEEIQRHYVRLIQRIIRKDFIDRRNQNMEVTINE
jgi:hypothetical protein